MDTIRIDADALFRAITATGYKLLAYNLDLRTGEIVSRTLSPDEVKSGPEAPSVKPLPKMGGDLAPKKDSSPFGPPPVSTKPKLFGDDGPKKPSFGGDFWKRDDKKKSEIFGDFKRESGSKKLAEIFSDAPKAKEKKDPFATPALSTTPGEPTPPPDTALAPDSTHDPYYPRVPAISEQTHHEWMRQFARETGDPQIRDELLAAANSAKPTQSYDRALRNHLRLAQQWERYVRKQALATADAWLASIKVKYELIERNS